MSATREVYISTDIETTGMCPGLHSMIQLGAVALLENGAELGTFEANLRELPDAVRLPSTMDWWAERPEVWAAVTANPRDPQLVMREFKAWCEAFEGHKVFIGYPVTFDFSFVWYYLWRFTDGAPFQHGGLDIKTMAMDALGSTYSNARKNKWPKRWLPDSVHAHTGLADAHEQAHEFLAIRQELQNRRVMTGLDSYHLIEVDY